MKKYFDVEIEIIRFESEDLIVTSGGDDPTCAPPQDEGCIEW